MARPSLQGLLIESEEAIASFPTPPHTLPWRDVLSSVCAPPEHLLHCLYPCVPPPSASLVTHRTTRRVLCLRWCKSQNATLADSHCGLWGRTWGCPSCV